MNGADDRLAALNGGRTEAATLAEVLAVDAAKLFRSVFPAATKDLVAEVDAIGRLGISARMAAVGRLLANRADPAAIDRLRRHRSDTVRGWTCFVIAAQDMPLPERLAAIRPFADDPHFGVREWSWLAVRPAIADRLDEAFGLLVDWTTDPSDRIRRFASEATRPRGVWCRHIASLKSNPEPGRALLDPLMADASVYVQDSVGNWLNDAAKTRPGWVRRFIAEWLDRSPVDETGRIARRALRSIETR